MSTLGETLLERVRKLEEMQRVWVALMALFAREDTEAEDKQQMIRVLLGLE